MAKSRKSAPNNGYLWFLFALGCLITGALVAYVKLTPADRIPASMTRAAHAHKPSGDGQMIEVVTPHREQDQLTFTAKKHALPGGKDARVFAVNSFLAEAKFVPQEARAVSCSLKSGIATIDFTPAFLQSYGSEDEGTVVNGIIRALGQFPEIDAVQFSVDGKPIQSLGNIDLSTPQKVLH